MYRRKSVDRKSRAVEISVVAVPPVNVPMESRMALIWSPQHCNLRIPVKGSLHREVESFEKAKLVGID